MGESVCSHELEVGAAQQFENTLHLFGAVTTKGKIYDFLLHLATTSLKLVLTKNDQFFFSKIRSFSILNK